MPDPLWGLLHYNVSMWHSKDLISIRFPRPQINPSLSLFSIQEFPTEEKEDNETFSITAENTGSHFHGKRQERRGSFVYALPKVMFCSLVIFFLMTVTFHFTLCWLSFDPVAIQVAKKWQYFLFRTSWLLRQLLVLNPGLFMLYWPCQHQTPLFIDRAYRGQTFVEETYGRSQECETHSWFLDPLIYSHFSASAQPHVK